MLLRAIKCRWKRRQATPEDPWGEWVVLLSHQNRYYVVQRYEGLLSDGQEEVLARIAASTFASGEVQEGEYATVPADLFDRAQAEHVCDHSCKGHPTHE